MKEMTINDFFNEIGKAIDETFNEIGKNIEEAFKKASNKSEEKSTVNPELCGVYMFNSSVQDERKMDKNANMLAKALCPTTINTNLKLKSRGEMITDLVDNYVWVDENGICWLVEDMNKEHLTNVFNKMGISEGHRKHVLSFIELVGTMKPASRKIFGADRFKAKEFSNSKVVRVVDVRTI